MTLSQKITEDLKTAMKAKDTIRISCLRLLKTAIKNKQVEKGKELNDDEIQGLISSLIRRGQESAVEFRKGNREDLARKEEKEMGVLYAYLPEQLSPADIEEALRKIIAELGANAPKDLGKVMKEAMSQMAGKAQGKEVNEIARRLLS